MFWPSHFMWKSFEKFQESYQCMLKTRWFSMSLWALLKSFKKGKIFYGTLLKACKNKLNFELNFLQGKHHPVWKSSTIFQGRHCYSWKSSSRFFLWPLENLLVPFKMSPFEVMYENRKSFQQRHHVQMCLNLWRGQTALCMKIR